MGTPIPHLHGPGISILMQTDKSSFLPETRRPGLQVEYREASCLRKEPGTASAITASLNSQVRVAASKNSSEVILSTHTAPPLSPTSRVMPNDINTMVKWGRVNHLRQTQSWLGRKAESTLKLESENWKRLPCAPAPQGQAPCKADKLLSIRLQPERMYPFRSIRSSETHRTLHMSMAESSTVLKIRAGQLSKHL